MPALYASDSSCDSTIEDRPTVWSVNIIKISSHYCCYRPWLTLCSINGTLFPGTRLWSWSSKVFRGTPNKPLSVHIQTYIYLECSMILQFCSSPAVCARVFVPLVLTLTALWGFRSIPAVSNRAVDSTTTSLRTWENIQEYIRQLLKQWLNAFRHN